MTAAMAVRRTGRTAVRCSWAPPCRRCRARHRGRVRRREGDRDLRAGRRHLRLQGGGDPAGLDVAARSPADPPAGAARGRAGAYRSATRTRGRRVPGARRPAPRRAQAHARARARGPSEGSARVLVVGLAALAEHGPEDAAARGGRRVAIDGDDEHRRLSRMREGLVARALAIGRPTRSPARRGDGSRAAARRLDAASPSGCGTQEAASNPPSAPMSQRTARAVRDVLGHRGAARPPAGFRPPIAEGWRRTLETEEPASLGLLDEPLDALEARVLGAADRDRARELVPVSWERFGEAVLLPWARERVAGAAWLAEWELADAADLAAMAAGAQRVEVLGFAVLVALADQGWSVEFEPPHGVIATGDDVSVDPLALVYGVAKAPSSRLSGELHHDDRDRACAARAPGGRRRNRHELARLPVAPPETTLELSCAAPSGCGAARSRSSRRCCCSRSRWPWRRSPRRYHSRHHADRAVVLVGMGVVLVGGIGWWARLRLRLAFARGRLVLDATTIRIEHAGLLRRPYELPRSLLRAAVGDPEGGRDPLGRPARFMLTTTPWDGPGSGDDLALGGRRNPGDAVPGRRDRRAEPRARV